MRFSDMMGSGDTPPAADEDDTAVADALKPYTDDEQPEVPAVAAPVAEAVPASIAVVPTPPVSPTPIAPMPPMTPIPVAIGPVDEDPIAISFTDFTPLSDDLLPRRR